MEENPVNSAHCQMTYAAFRAAFVVTLDCLLRHSLDPASAGSATSGFLDAIPVLRGTAPQIQLECLLGTWERQKRGVTEPANLLEECVVYAACETLANLSLDRKGKQWRAVFSGPRVIPDSSNHWICSKVRCLQITRSTPVKSSVLGEILLGADEGPQVGRWRPGDCNSARENLLNIVGRWPSEMSILQGSEGLLTENEQDILKAFFEEHPGLAR